MNMSSEIELAIIHTLKYPDFRLYCFRELITAINKTRSWRLNRYSFDESYVRKLLDFLHGRSREKNIVGQEVNYFQLKSILPKIKNNLLNLHENATDEIIYISVIIILAPLITKGYFVGLVNGYHFFILFYRSEDIFDAPAKIDEMERVVSTQLSLDELGEQLVFVQQLEKELFDGHVSSSVSSLMTFLIAMKDEKHKKTSLFSKLFME